MTTLLEAGTSATSPLDNRVMQQRYVSLEEAEQDALNVYYGWISKKSLAGAFVALAFLLLFGFQLINHQKPGREFAHLLVGGSVMLASTVGLAYVIYEWRRKYRVFILDEALAVERRFNSNVELVKWTDIAKVYCLDRTTTTGVYIWFFRIGSTKRHEGKLRIVLVDGRRIVITSQVQRFSELAHQVNCRTTAAQLVPCTKFIIEGGGRLDFDKFAVTFDHLILKRKQISWDDIHSASLNGRGRLTFKTKKTWWSPRFALETIPNASLLLEMLSMFGVQWTSEP